MKTFRLFCLAALIAAAFMTSAAHNAATAESAAVTTYKQAVTKRVEQWSSRMNSLNGDLTKARTELGMLSAPNPQVPTTDPQAAIKVVQDKITRLKDTINFETNTLLTDLAMITVSPKDKSETIPLPGFIRDLVKAKGIPLSQNASFTPNINWNFKSGTLGSASGTINITFQNP